MGWATAAPYIATGIGALGRGLMQHGSGDQNIVGYPEDPIPMSADLLSPYNVYAPDMLAKAAANLEHYGGVATERASRPTYLEGTQVQPTPWYGGARDDPWQGGMAMPVGLSGLDPALIRPSLLGRPGIRFGGPAPTSQVPLVGEQAKSLFPGAPRRDETESNVEFFTKQGSQLPQYEGLRQPPTPGLEPGGGFASLFGALKLLGVERDPMGNLAAGRDWPHFTGALPYQKNRGRVGGTGTGQGGTGTPDIDEGGVRGDE